jgi:hypothetical protein
MRFTKVLSFIDLIIQTILLGGTVIMLIKLLWEGGSGFWGAVLYFAMLGAMFIGPWQMLSSLITTAARAPKFRLRAIHLASSTIYLLIVYGANSYVDPDVLNDIHTPFMEAIVYGIPAVLAVFYYYITITTP